jgi:hypothetical protein
MKAGGGRVRAPYVHHMMGRRSKDDEGNPPERRRDHFADHRTWIAETWAGHPTLDPSLLASGALLSGHGPGPAELDPLVDLSFDIESTDQQCQLDELESVYGDEVMHGLGLHLISLGRAEEPWQWRLQEATEQKIAAEQARQRCSGNGDVDFDTLILLQLRLYDAREAQLHWACEALGWPSEWALAYLRHSGSVRFDYGPPARVSMQVEEDPYPAPDPELEMALWKRHGLCPDAVDPLRELDALIQQRSRNEQLAAIERRYRPWALRRAAIEEFLAGEDTEAASELAEYLRHQVDEGGHTSASAMRGVLCESVRLEAMIVWSAQALGLEASSLITYLTRRAARMI